MQQDRFSIFRQLYACGEGKNAFAALLGDLELSYNEFEHEEQDRHEILNYVDALCCLRPEEARLANLRLQSCALLGDFHEALLLDEVLLLLASLPPDSKSPLPYDGHFSEWEEAYRREREPPASTPANIRIRLLEHLAHKQRWSDFLRDFLDLSVHLPRLTSYLPLTFPWRQPSPIITDKELVLVFVEPVQIDWHSWLAPLEQCKVVFCFSDALSLSSCLAFEPLSEALRWKNSWLQVLDQYPATLLGAQVPLPGPTELEFVAVANRPLVEPFYKPLADAFKGVLAAPVGENPANNWLYQVGRRLCWSIRANRLGRRRRRAFLTNCDHSAWQCRFKGDPPHGADVGPELPREVSLPNALKRESRTSRSVKRIAHIVPQLVDGGHAPTRLYRTLFAHHDRSKYEIDLLVTEEFIFRTSQYPFPRFVSASSQKRGPQALQEIQQGGANTWIAPHALDFDSLAALIGHELKRRNVDVAVFHGATPVNLLAARCARTSCLALFDHGLLPVNGGFDLYLSANQEEASRSFDGAVKILPHVVDIRANWPLDPPSLGRFGVPADSLGLTTISFHLEDRLSTPMCQAVAEILYCVPTAYYLPIGPVTESAKHRILAPFHKRGVSKRLRFLDRQENPSHLARAMTLYLNEFPIGSGVALLDAMAAGLPIVSMYDENGAHQARYAANAFGKDRTVHSLNPSDYVDLAVQLLQDAAKRREWSNHALRQYESRGTASEYVSKFEQILEAWWKRE